MPVQTVTELDQVMETWELTVPGRVWVQTTTHNRFGQPITKDISVGPNKVGAKLKISVADREMNQENVAESRHDPFTNGILVRVNGGDPMDPVVTEAPDAVSASDLTAIFTKNGNAFQAAVNKLGEIPVRRMVALAGAVDATAKQVEYLDKVLNEKFRNPDSSQGTGNAVFDLTGNRVGSDGSPFGDS